MEENPERSEAFTVSHLPLTPPSATNSCHRFPASHVCSARSALGGPGADVVGVSVWGLIQSRITPCSWLQLWGRHLNWECPGMCSPPLGAGPEWATWSLSSVIQDVRGFASLPTSTVHYCRPVNYPCVVFPQH